MKMIKKITAVTAALAAAASMSAVAFAGDFTATYDKDADTVSVTNLTATFSDQITVVIVPNGAESISSENIYYIDQDSVANKDALLTGMGVLAGSMVAGNTYEVRIGCTEGDIYTATFTVEADEPAYPLGDANLDSYRTTDDASKILDVLAGNDTFADGAKKYADANQDDYVTTDDASKILDVLAGNDTMEWK